jgi:uncharacterized protein (TIGR03435 family)
MQIVRLAVIIAIMAGSSVSGQTQTFEIAAVKPNTSGDLFVRGGTRGRAYNAVNMPLRRIIATAYELQLEEFRLVGDQPLLAERFDITATIPETASPRQVPAMLRALLAERFKLAVHTETRDASVLALTIERGDGRLGPNLRQAAFDCAAAETAGRAIPPPEPGQPPICESEISDRIKGRGQPLSSLARMLTMFMQRRVLDKTGLIGGFDFDLQFEGAAAGPSVDASSALVTALEDQLGLKLQSTRAPVDFVVIDAIERPAAN